MRLQSVLPFIASLTVAMCPLLAQERLPNSYLNYLAIAARLERLTLDDVKGLASKAQSGEPVAQYLLALIYDQGRLLPRDRESSRQWMLKAAEQGYVPAQVGLGEMYLANARTGPVPDYPDAERWLRMAATQGDAEAQFWLGAGYERGFFGVIDYREASSGCKWRPPKVFQMRSSVWAACTMPEKASRRAMRKQLAGTGGLQTTSLTSVEFGRPKFRWTTCTVMVDSEKITSKLTCGQQSLVLRKPTR